MKNSIQNSLMALSLVFLPAAAGAQDNNLHAKVSPTTIHTSIPLEQRPPPAEASIPEEHEGTFRGSDIRHWSGMKLDDAPYSASNGRLALILYGDNRNAKGAAEYVGKLFAKQAGVDVSFLWASDNNDSPNDVLIAGYANGFRKFELDVGNARTPTDIALKLIPGMKKAWQEEFGSPKVAKANPGPDGMDNDNP